MCREIFLERLHDIVALCYHLALYNRTKLEVISCMVGVDNVGDRGDT